MIVAKDIKIAQQQLISIVKLGNQNATNIKMQLNVFKYQALNFVNGRLIVAKCGTINAKQFI